MMSLFVICLVFKNYQSCLFGNENQIEKNITGENVIQEQPLMSIIVNVINIHAVNHNSPWEHLIHYLPLMLMIEYVTIGHITDRKKKSNA